MSARNTSSSMEDKSKGLHLPKTVLILLVLITTGVIAGGFFQKRIKNQNEANLRQDLSGLASPNPSAQAGSRKDWATHLDAANHFSIKYPSNWEVYEKSGLGYSFQSPDLSTGYGGKVNKGIYVRFFSRKETTGSVNPSSSDDVLIKWFINTYGNVEEVKLLSEPRRLDLAGYPAVMAERETFLFGKSITAVVVSEESSLVFDCFYDESNQEEAKEIFKQMLDTLQIIP